MKKYMVVVVIILSVFTVLAIGLEFSNTQKPKADLLLPAEGIPEAGISKEELMKLIESAKVEKFFDPTGKFDEAKLRNFTSPVMVVVKKLKAKGYSDEEIVEILKKYNMGYDPKTGATWIGRTPTPEELEKLPPRKYPFKDASTTAKPEEEKIPSLPPRKYPFKDVSTTPGLEQRNAVMEVAYPQFRGINNKMKPGSLAVKEGESLFHVATTHVGRGGNWTEVGVIRSVNDYRWQLFTYDDDEGGYCFHGTTSADVFNNYIIYVYPNYNKHLYNIWIDGNWVRQGCLPYLENSVDQANEVWSGSFRFTSDTNSAVHKEPFLYIGDTAIWWDESVLTRWWRHVEVCETHYIDGSAWRFTTWVCP
ncbi:MAG: hypothetical protein ACK401_04005 [Archaeoglobaceae archaeon]